ncbi:Uncharacterised protein [uncultured archaeon]|nr:Uncharacterised protein [uncultured archaeon]
MGKDDSLMDQLVSYIQEHQGSALLSETTAALNADDETVMGLIRILQEHQIIRVVPQDDGKTKIEMLKNPNELAEKPSGSEEDQKETALPSRSSFAPSESSEEDRRVSDLLRRLRNRTFDKKTKKG